MNQIFYRDIVPIGGLLFILAVFLRILFLLYSLWKESKNRDLQRQLNLKLLTQRFEAAKIRIADQKQNHAPWNGYRKFVVRKIIKESNSVSSFYLYPHDKKPLPSFRPGQHLVFKLHIPGRSQPLIRCYSLSNGATQSEWYRVSIKKIPAPPDNPDAPPGLSSNYFHTQVQEGDILDVKAPSGKFFLDMTANAPAVFLAGGIGLTPLLSMVETLAYEKSEREFWLFYGTQNSCDQIMKDQLEKLNAQFPNMHLHIFHSDPDLPTQQDSKNFNQGHISLQVLKQLLPSNNYEFYVCGPPRMMQALIPQLKEWGVPDSKIFSEAFGPASIKKSPSSSVAQSSAPAIEVKFAKSSKMVQWDVTAGSLLEFSENQGVAIESGCRSGICGTCLTTIISGEVVYHTTPGEKPAVGSCLPCVSIPKGNLVLDA